MHKPLAILVIYSLVSSSQAAVTLYAEYDLGEAGSLGTNSRPQDSSGNNHHFGNDVGGTPPTLVTLGLKAPESTAALNLPGGNVGFFSNSFASLATDNFAIGIWVNPNLASTSYILTTGSVANSYAIRTTGGGFNASISETTWVGDGGSDPDSGDFTIGQWYHLALIRQNGTTTFYVDGAATGSTTNDTGEHGGAHLGVRPGNGFNANAQLDSYRVVEFDSTESTATILTALNIPEPSTMLLGLVGGLMAIARRHR